ncbi:MAG: FAD dependent oxidoreductase, putative [uncultured Solirubrobacteraceae bacterium]|uniref:FAD dependent oxidoreductase, putative n=1 Tax=uncultured Solirubrobacteraceae bacterium TaxID=1162706 RepID=A0A6J4TTC5_9ACTN|nr:MAG: FAD dependent oxidoreductase, putative [uncultured Solirubrobacteraceae bacterium]
MSDIGVVGAGIVGLATAYAARARGATVTVYERGVPGNGQSGGDSRIFRHAHADPRLVALAVEAKEGWRAWEAELGTELLVCDGVVVLGPAAGDRLGVLEDAGIDARLVDDATDWLPILAPRAAPSAVGSSGAAAGPDAISGLVDPGGGVIRTRAAVAALARSLGEAIVADEVLAVRLLPSGRVEVRAGGVTVEHDRVVVCAGRGTPDLARGAGLDIAVRESVHVRLTFALRDGPAPRLACVLDTEAGAYGDPLPGNAHYAIGIGDTDQPGLAAEAERTVEYVARRFPGLEPEPVGVRHCWVTELPWGHDGIGVWEAGGASFVAGNNLFKHAPALGAALAADTLRVDLRPTAQFGAGPSRGAPRR